MKARILAAVLGAATAFAGGLAAGALAQATWHNPRTWVAGSELTAQQLNDQVRDNLLWLRSAHDTLRSDVDNFDLSPTGLAANPSAATLYRGNDTWYPMLDANGRLLNTVLGAGTPTAGQILLYGAAGRPEWNYPFEFPTTRSGRSITASTTQTVIVTSTLQVAHASPFDSVAITAATTVTRTGTAECELGFSNRSSAVIARTRTNGGAITITAQHRFATATAIGNAAPLSLWIRALVGGTTCTAAAGTTLTLSRA